MKHLKSIQIFESEYNTKKPSDRTMSASDLLKQDFGKGLDFESNPRYDYMFGSPANNFSMMIHGEPGSGKTSFLLDFALYLTLFGKVIYISSEEYGSKSLQTRFKEALRNNDEVHVNDSDDSKVIVPSNLEFAKGMTDLEDYDFIIVDSVNDMDLDIMSFKEIHDIYDNKAFILVFQSIKEEGGFRGGKDWVHEVDIAAEIVEGIVYIHKNRYGIPKVYDFFNNIKIEDPEEIKDRI